MRPGKKKAPVPRDHAAAGHFRHSHALVESTTIGAGTRIWAFAHVLPGAVIGPIATSAITSSSRTT